MNACTHTDVHMHARTHASKHTRKYTNTQMSPVNEYVGPLLEEVFHPFVKEGFLTFAYGGLEVV